jgi:hypothetical protein
MYKLLRNGSIVFEGSLADCSARLPPEADESGNDGDGAVWVVVPLRSAYWGRVDSASADIYLEGGEVPAKG